MEWGSLWDFSIFVKYRLEFSILWVIRRSSVIIGRSIGVWNFFDVVVFGLFGS